MKDELKHYGVRGMKWGVRKTPNEIKKERSKHSLKFKGPQCQGAVNSDKKPSRKSNTFNTSKNSKIGPKGYPSNEAVKKKTSGKQKTARLLATVGGVVIANRVSTRMTLHGVPFMNPATRLVATVVAGKMGYTAMVNLQEERDRK